MPGTVSVWVDGRSASGGDGDLAAGVETIHVNDERSRTVSVYDLAVQRGDGIFEATSVWRGIPLSLESHLRRLQHSARILDLPAFRLDVIREGVAAAIDRYTELFTPADDEEQMLKILISRGSDPQLAGGRELDPGIPHVWILVDHRDPDARDPQPQRLITLPKGVSAEAPRENPWMLWGAKTLSYAMNKAVYRECGRRDADTAIFTSTEGLMLECPTSSVVFRVGDRFFTPEPTLGILWGTTQREFFAFVRAQGFTCEYGRYPIEKLGEADAIWTMSSSVAHPVVAYEGVEIASDPDLAAEANLFARDHHEKIAAESLAELDRFQF